MEKLQGVEALTSLSQGVSKLADAVEPTIGKYGKNVIFQSENGVVVSNDGVTILHHYKLSDPVEEMGAQVVRQAAFETNRIAGDGTTTATVLARALLENLHDEYSVANRLALNEEIERVVDNLKSASKKPTRKQVRDVAVISSGSEKLGEVVAKAVLEAVDGVTVERSTKPGVSFSKTSGVIAGPSATKYLLPNKGSQRLENVKLHIFKNALNDLSKIVHHLEEASANSQGIAFLAPEYGDEVIYTLVRNKEVLPSIAAICTDPEEVVDKLGVDMNTESWIEVKSIVSTEKETVITSENAKRVVGQVLIGAATEVEFVEQRLRAEDAINAVQAAQKDGVVKGGGVALKEASVKSAQAIKNALEAPFNAIAVNTGEVSEDVIDPTLVVITALKSAASAVFTLLTTETVIYEKGKK